MGYTREKNEALEFEKAAPSLDERNSRNNKIKPMSVYASEDGKLFKIEMTEIHIR